VDRAAFLLRDWLVPHSRVRANIFVPQDTELVLAYQANMDGDPDEHIRLSRGQGITSLVYSRRATIVADLRDHRQSGGIAPAGSDLYLTNDGAPAILLDRTWLLSMPLVDITEIMWPELPLLTGSAPRTGRSSTQPSTTRRQEHPLPTRHQVTQLRLPCST
jgi:hypothetical protein